MGVPFVDLKAQYHSIKEEIDAALIGTMESCAFTLGPEVAQLEKDFAVYAGAAHAAGVNNGTSALHLALLAAGIGAGDEVITVPFTFIASASAIHYTGAKPVFVDIDPVTFTMDPAAIEAAITPRTKAIVPVHLYGQMADMDAIMAIAKKHGLFVLEDAAQAHGAEYKGRRAGSIGDAAGFSFYPGKNMGAAGEGGMTVTQHTEINRKVRMLRDWGAEKKYHHEIIGYNMRLEGIQGAVLRVKMKYIEKWTEMRRDAAARYDAMFKGTGVATPVALSNRRHVYHIYAIRTKERARWIEALNAKGIQTGIHYPFPLHTLKAFDFLGYKQGQFPNSEKAAAEVLSLPMYPELNAVQQEEVVSAVAALQAQSLQPA
jgi:dTDP-4-amino-4,6-dideoxygalactose transaminase